MKHYRAAAFAHERLSSRTLSKRFPQIALDRETEGIWEPDSGVLMARRAVQAVVEASGVDYEIRAGGPNLRARNRRLRLWTLAAETISRNPARPHPPHAPGSFFLRHAARI